MTAGIVPRFPEDADLGPLEQEGIADFALFRLLSASTNEDWRRGWWLAWARCYGQGVRAAMIHRITNRVHPVSNPHPQFSGPWEAWAAGHDDEERL